MVRDGSCFVPFGLGPYVCAGKQLGLMKVRAMIAGLVVGFEWKLADGTGPVDGELLGKDEFTVAFEECWVDFKKI
jgi:cytochrome P450